MKSSPSGGTRLFAMTTVLLMCFVGGGATPMGGVLSLFNGRPLTRELTTVDVPELDLPGVEQVLAAADELLLSPSSDPELLRAHTGLQHLVLKLQPNASTYPVTRRTVLFALKSRAADCSNATQQHVCVDVSHALHKHFKLLYQEGKALKHDLIHYFHIPKCGGSAVCELAQRQAGVKVAPGPCCTVKEFMDHPQQYPWANLVPTQDIQAWLATRPWDSRPNCEARVKALNEQGITFFANNLALFGSQNGLDAVVCPSFINVVMLRNPLSRAVAHYVHKKRQLAKVDHHVPDTFDQLVNFMPQIADNFVIRSFLGFQVFHLPYGRISEHHLLAARWKLFQFDTVLLLEEPEKDDAVLSGALGWTNGSLSHHLSSVHLRFVPERNLQQHLGGNATSGKQQSHLGTPFDGNVDMLYYFAVANSLDLELYKFGRRLFDLDHEFFTRMLHDA